MAEERRKEDKTVAQELSDFRECFHNYVDEDKKWKEKVDLTLAKLTPVSDSIDFYQLVKKGAKELVSWVLPITTVGALAYWIRTHIH